MKASIRVKSLMFAVTLTLSLATYCQKYYDENDDWQLQCACYHVKTGAGCDLKFVNSLQNEKEFPLNGGTMKISVGTDETIHYKHLKSVILGPGNEATFENYVDEPIFFIGLGTGSDVKFKRGIKCRTFYAEVQPGSEMKIDGKAEFGRAIFNLSTGSEIKITSLDADTLVIIGSGYGSELKINGNVGVLIYCKDFSTEIRGKFRTKRMIEDNINCKKLRKEIKKFYKQLLQESE